MMLYLNGRSYKARLNNLKIDAKYGNHADMVHIRYSGNSDIANALRGCFNRSYAYIKRIEVPDTNVQYEAVEMFSKKEEFNDALSQIKEYVMDNGGSENGVRNIDNIFKYVMPRCIYVPKANKRVVAILCDYRFDPEHGIAVVYENEVFSHIDEEGMVI